MMISSSRIQMYKKKLRQWNIRSQRKGWAVRRQTTGAGFRAEPPSRATQTQARTLSLPSDFRDRQAALYALCDAMRRGFKLMLPAGHKPVTTIEQTARDIPAVPVPQPFLDFLLGISFGIRLLNESKDKYIAIGASFEKSSVAIGPMLDTDFVMGILFILPPLLQTLSLQHPEVSELFLKQIYRLSRLKPKAHHFTLWTSWILGSPSQVRAQAIELTARAGSDIVLEVLGQYSRANLVNRCHYFGIKSSITGVSGPEYVFECQEHLQACKAAMGEESFVTLLAQSIYSTALERYGELAKAAKAEERFPVLLKNMSKNDGHPLTMIWQT